MIPPLERWIELNGLRLHARQWSPQQPDPARTAFLLYHGLSSNAATWDLVAADLFQAGHQVFSVDQRGHGRSDKPDDGYDFATLANDVRLVVEQLGLENLILAGQSWGGNVALEVAVRYPGLALGYIFVDGGFLNLRQRGTWQDVSRELRPPDLAGTPVTLIKEMIGSMHPSWIPDGVTLTLQNFELLPDGTVRPRLTLDRHMAILRALYDQDVTSLFPGVVEPVLICPAEDGSEWSQRKAEQVAAAAENIANASLHWFNGAAHDIHVDRPHELAKVMLAFSERISS